MENGMRGIVDKIFPVIVGDDLCVLRQHGRVQLVDFRFDRLHNRCGIFSLAHDYDGLYDIVLVDNSPVTG